MEDISANGNVKIMSMEEYAHKLEEELIKRGIDVSASAIKKEAKSRLLEFNKVVIRNIRLH